MSQVDPTAITTYQIEARNATIQGNAVLVPTLDGENMQAIISVFQGRATLADAPDQVFATTTAPLEVAPSTEAPSPTTTRPGSLSSATDTEATGTKATDTAATTTTATTLPAVEADEIVVGVAPDPNAVCE
jgi:hypothetical protein